MAKKKATNKAQTKRKTAKLSETEKALKRLPPIAKDFKNVLDGKHELVRL